MVLVAIPYIASEAQGHEMFLALTGWRKHFQEPMHLITVGDRPPQECVGLVDGMMTMPRVEVPLNGRYRPHLDLARKQLCVALRFEGIYKECIWVADDCYPVNDFTLADVALPKIQDFTMPTTGDGPWWNDLHKTRDLCEKEGFALHNWTTHLPRLYNLRKLHKVIVDYNLLHESYVVENIYYNKFNKKTPTLLRSTDKWKYSVHSPDLDRPALADAFARKVWIVNSNHGWSEALEAELRKHYGL